MSLIEEALGGSHIVNCEHTCVQKPCGLLSSCVPNNDNFECVCNPKNNECNQAEEVPSDQLKAEIQRKIGEGGIKKISGNKRQYNFDVVHLNEVNILFYNDEENSTEIIKVVNRIQLDDPKTRIGDRIINESKLSNHIENNFHNSIVRVTVKKSNHGACFSGENSYLHFNNTQTMKRLNNYQFDLNVRFKTIVNSSDGLILWTGKRITNDYFLLLGVVDG